MNLSATIVVYIVVALISAVLKRAGGQKAARGRPPLKPVPTGIPSAPDLAEAEAPVQIFEESVEKEEPDLFQESEFRKRPDEDFAESGDLQWTLSEAPRRRFDLAQAVIMSEILRMPRAKRRWPER